MFGRFARFIEFFGNLFLKSFSERSRANWNALSIDMLWNDTERALVTLARVKRRLGAFRSLWLLVRSICQWCFNQGRSRSWWFPRVRTSSFVDSGRRLHFVFFHLFRPGETKRHYFRFETTVDNEQRRRIKSLIGRFRTSPCVELLDQIKTTASSNSLRASIGALMTPPPAPQSAAASEGTSLTAGIELARGLLRDLRSKSIKIKPGNNDTSAELSRKDGVLVLF